ncbi:MAG: 3'-5' exonuclease, partial [Nitrososphaera sp.]
SDPGSVVLSIGACRFDPNTDHIHEETFYTNLRIQPQLDAGLTVNGDTIRWWFSQNSEAIKALLESPVHFPKPALQHFNEWFHTGGTFAWSHGSDFDLVLLKCLYKAFGFERPPWAYRNARDTRTLFALAPGYWEGRGSFVREETLLPNIPFVEHNALADAIQQARWVQYAFERLRLSRIPIA